MLSAATFVAVVGQVTHVDMELDSMPEVVRGVLKGTLHVPVEWDFESILIEARLEGSYKPGS